MASKLLLLTLLLSVFSLAAAKGVVLPLHGNYKCALVLFSSAPPCPRTPSTSHSPLNALKLTLIASCSCTT